MIHHMNHLLTTYKGRSDDLYTPLGYYTDHHPHSHTFEHSQKLSHTNVHTNVHTHTHTHTYLESPWGWNHPSLVAIVI